MLYKTVGKVWQRLENNMDQIINKLRFKHKFTTATLEEIKSEVQTKFFQLYYEVYEHDNQFLRFMFVVTKNVIHDMQRKEYRYTNRHSCDLHKLRSKFQITLNDSDVDDSYLRIINEIAVDNIYETDITEKLIYKELMEAVESILINPIHIRIFRLMLDKYRPNQISEEIDKPVGYIGQVKRTKIYPAVKEVLEIPDDEYKWLAASGRIFCTA